MKASYLNQKTMILDACALRRHVQAHSRARILGPNVQVRKSWIICVVLVHPVPSSLSGQTDVAEGTNVSFVIIATVRKSSGERERGPSNSKSHPQCEDQLQLCMRFRNLHLARGW